MALKGLGAGAISVRVQAWTDQVRAQGFEALWHRLSDEEREEFVRFASRFDEILALEAEKRWQAAVDAYQGLAESFPPYSDVAIERAGYLVNEKINRAIRYYNNGVRALEAKMYNKAMQYFDLALGIDPYMERALYNLGMAHKLNYLANPEANHLSKVSAIEAFKKLLKINPGHLRAAAQVEQMSRL
ncbi:MAG: hypothetical protein D6679_13950 [Candidatus Hydrogenedentota bacterium]|nr:MAG: hypothetical protein D6679_13950 [Candidatus Hydrogenedentota bacterium]